jgi:hypothetical protein
MTAISRSRGRRAVRTTVAAGAVSLGLAALTGCEQPSPSAHFTLNASTKSLETAGDCFGHGDGLSAAQARDCLIDTDNVRSFTTEVGDTFRVGVDPDVAEQGWVLLVNGNPMAIERSHTTYRSFQTDELYAASEAQPVPGTEGEFTDVVQVSVVQLGEDFEEQALSEAYQQAQMGSPDAWNTAFFGQFQGVWNVQFEKKSH